VHVRKINSLLHLEKLAEKIISASFYFYIKHIDKVCLIGYSLKHKICKNIYEMYVLKGA
jgi:hypothetical protein